MSYFPLHKKRSLPFRISAVNEEIFSKFTEEMLKGRNASAVFKFCQQNNWRDKLSEKNLKIRKSAIFYHPLKSKEMKHL